MARVGTMRQALRVVSLLPSATENFCALIDYATARTAACESGTTSGERLLPVLVGRSHECDFPITRAVQDLPELTKARTAFTTSADTHKQVRDALEAASSLYVLDADRLVALKPDVILTQSTCKVCSIDLATVERSVTANGANVTDDGVALCATTARIVTCNPTSLEDALVSQFETMGRELGLSEDGAAMVQAHLQRLEELKARARAQANGVRQRVLVVEWLDPLFIGKTGWMRDMVEAAGAEVVESIEHGADVDAVVVALCGLSLDKTREEIEQRRAGTWWSDLLKHQATSPRVFVVDGMSMFTRPTSRLLTALEWLVEILYDADGKWQQTSTFPFVQLKPQQLAEAVEREEEVNKAPDIEDLHLQACINKQAMYEDPTTGYSVLTAYYLAERQTCCGNGCRHCPYGHANVKDPAKRTNKLNQPAFLKARTKRGQLAGGRSMWPVDWKESEDSSPPRDLVVMFWSGGKDSFLALGSVYDHYARASAQKMPQVVLLTTVDPDEEVVPVQNIPMRQIIAQAQALDLPLCLVPVKLGSTYTTSVTTALDDLATRLGKSKIDLLVFGDLHLEDIRTWRQGAFGSQYRLLFPLWKLDPETELLPKLEQLCQQTAAQVCFSSVESKTLKDLAVHPGSAYAWRDLKRCSNVDLMGENGEFHTIVMFPNMIKERKR